MGTLQEGCVQENSKLLFAHSCKKECENGTKVLRGLVCDYCHAFHSLNEHMAGSKNPDDCYKAGDKCPTELPDEAQTINISSTKEVIRVGDVFKLVEL